MIGIEDSIEEGTVVTLMCRSSGARPAASITWFNGSTPFSELASETVALKVRNTFSSSDRDRNLFIPISFLFLFLRLNFSPHANLAISRRILQKPAVEVTVKKVRDCTKI